MQTAMVLCTDTCSSLISCHRTCSTGAHSICPCSGTKPHCLILFFCLRYTPCTVRSSCKRARVSNLFKYLSIIVFASLDRAGSAAHSRSEASRRQSPGQL